MFSVSVHPAVTGDLWVEGGSVVEERIVVTTIAPT